MSFKGDMIMNFRQRLHDLPKNRFADNGGIFLKEITSEDDLAIAIFDLSLSPEQQAMVNPAGFSIGRAYLFPENNVPYLIYATEDGRKIPVGFILLRFNCPDDEISSDCLSANTPSTTWSYFISEEYQGNGYGVKAARLALNLLSEAASEYTVKLSTEQENKKAQKLYTKLGFKLSEEKDGDDLIFIYTPTKPEK